MSKYDLMSSYDFERIGKQKVLDDLLVRIKSKADSLRIKDNMTDKEKMDNLKELEQMIVYAHKVQGDLLK